MGRSVLPECNMQKMLYRPLTAAPFRQNGEYREVMPRHAELSRYIRCFWGSEHPYVKKSGNTGIVVPDTCADIIYWIDYTANRVSGGFCGINDVSFSKTDESMDGHLVSLFAVRFYAWEACAFSEDSMRETRNGYFDVQTRFRWLDRLLRPMLFEKCSLEERSGIVEEMFLRKLQGARQHPSVHHAVMEILLHKGVLNAARLAKECFISDRQLERIFHEYIGITPKKFCNLVRYQSVWGDALRNPFFKVQDAVWQYGYTDQSHLLREFKRYHAMDIQAAREYAYHVGNIQYSQDVLC